MLELLQPQMDEWQKKNYYVGSSTSGIKLKNGEHRLLVLDHYKLHHAADAQSLVESLNTDLYIPAGCSYIHLSAHGCLGQFSS